MNCQSVQSAPTRLRLLCLIACWGLSFALGSPAALHAGVNEKAAKASAEDFNQEPRRVRSDHPLNPLNYVEYAGEFYPYRTSRRFKRVAQRDEAFHIRKLHFSDREIHCDLESDTGVRERVTLYEPISPEMTQVLADVVLELMLQDLFEFGSESVENRYVGNTKSRKLHLRGCNHLPAESLRTPIASLADAQAQGYAECPFCFADFPLLPIAGYARLRQRAVERARIHELIFPLVEDEVVQEELRSAGDDVLDHFPIDLTGYEYEFKVVHSEFAQAIAFPTGFVYVTDRLYDSIEDPAELAFILAHEVAHVELHLSSRHSPEDIEGTLAMSQAFELEADIVAAYFLSKLGELDPSLAHAANVLRKLQYGDEVVPSDDRMSHPAFAERIEVLSAIRFVDSSMQMSSCGLNGSGQRLVTVRLIGSGSYQNSSFIFVHIETSDLLEAPLTLGGRGKCGSIEAGKGRALASPRPIEVGPGDRSLVRLNIVTTKGTGYYTSSVVVQQSAELIHDLQLDNLEELKLGDVKNCKKWVICDDS